ncbi:hypothetical protein D3C87_103090 [compost metagenome]
MNHNFLRAILTLSFFFQASAAVAALPAEVAKFLNKEGRFISLYNGDATRESGGTCRITMSEFGDEYTISIQASTYFKINADLEGATRSVAGNGVVVYKLKDHGKRPGGSACGDFVPMTSYSKTLEITENVLLVRQKFKCGFFEKNDIMEVCDLSK